MNLRFTDATGNQTWIRDAATFNTMVEAGQITPESMLYDESLGAWRRADGLPEFHAAYRRRNPQAGPYSEVPLYGVPATEAIYGGADSSPQQPPSVLFGTLQPEPPQEGTWPSTTGMISIVVGALLIMFVSIKYSSSAYTAGYRVGVVAGISLWIALGAFLVWRFALNKRKGMGLLIFGAGFFLVCTYQSLSAVNDSKLSGLAEADIGALLKKAMNGEPIEPKDYDEKTYGAAAPMLKIMNDYMTGLQADSMKMNEEMTRLRLETLLTEETLRNAEQITRGQARLQSMREIMDRYESLFKQRANDLPAKVMSSDVDEKIKREFLNGFNQTKDQGLRMLSQLFEIERRFASKAEEMLDFVKQRQGQYRFLGSTIQFASRQDELEYNRLVDQVNKIAEEETEWQEQAQRQMRRKYEDFQKATKRR
jgi:hypothetical protein